MFYGENSNVIVIDLDGTIAIIDSSVDYENRIVDHLVLSSILSASESGYKIVVHTSRNVRKFQGNGDEINRYTKPAIHQWLSKNQIFYNDLVVSKPWCGPNGYYVDDRSLSIDEFNFKFSGPFARFKFDVVIPCFNEAGNFNSIYSFITRIDRLINLNNIIMINNGSSDGTESEIDNLMNKLSIVKKINSPYNLGYGGGLKKGISESSAECIMLCHADMQYDPYLFILNNIDSFSAFSKKKLIQPFRLNRPYLSTIRTLILRLILSLIAGKKIQDFNGQPKIFFRDDVNEVLNKFPDDYTFDFALCAHFAETINLPVLEKKRIYGKSSWGGFIRSISIFINYIKYAIVKRFQA